MNNQFNISDPLEQEIAEYLYWYHKGIGNAISNKRLANRFNLDERTLRQLIVNLIVNSKIPIGSCSKNHSGIFFIDSESEFKIASDELLSRIKKLSKRHKALRMAYKNYKNEQIEQLELSGVGNKKTMQPSDEDTIWGDSK